MWSYEVGAILVGIAILGFAGACCRQRRVPEGQDLEDVMPERGRQVQQLRQQHVGIVYPPPAYIPPTNLQQIPPQQIVHEEESEAPPKYTP
jgi:hypothetical protein